MPSTDEFYEEQTDQSAVKIKIVCSYFGAWSKIIRSNPHVDRMAYIDLYCGPGIYEDGNESTPIKILKMCISDPVLCNKMVFKFNDEDPKKIEKLKTSIGKLEGIENLRYKPIISSLSVDSNMAKEFQKTQLVPTFSFVDPWGYEGLTYDLINALTKDWGSDCIFYFNYLRINAALSNPRFQGHMKALFGEELLEEVREKIKSLTPLEREHYILNTIGLLFDQAGLYSVPFRFQRKDQDRTSHYIIFVSKHPLGYTIAKSIMAGQSTAHDENSAGFEYVPVQNPQLTFLYKYAVPLSKIREIILKRYKGKKATVEEIFFENHIGTPFILKNFQSTLLELQAQGLITVENPDGNMKVRKNSMPKHYIITFV